MSECETSSLLAMNEGFFKPNFIMNEGFFKLLFSPDADHPEDKPVSKPDQIDEGDALCCIISSLASVI